MYVFLRTISSTSHFQIEIILWSRLDIPVDNKNDNKEHVTLNCCFHMCTWLLYWQVQSHMHVCTNAFHQHNLVWTTSITIINCILVWAWQWNCGFDRRDQKRLTCMRGVKREYYMAVLHKRLLSCLSQNFNLRSRCCIF